MAIRYGLGERGGNSAWPTVRPPRARAVIVLAPWEPDCRERGGGSPAGSDARSARHRRGGVPGDGGPDHFVAVTFRVAASSPEPKSKVAVPPVAVRTFPLTVMANVDVSDGDWLVSTSVSDVAVSV